MKNFDITKVQLSSILEDILGYTGETYIRNVCEKLNDGLVRSNISFDMFQYYIDTIYEWYPQKIDNIHQNTFVRYPENHERNIKLIEELVNDINECKDEYTELLSSPRIKKENPRMSEDEIFVVHGHDDGLKNEVARFLEKLNFKPIILHEKASSGDTIIEKIERYSNVGFGIVLYTPCDVGSTQKNQTKLQPRARQNVVFEHGYLIGKLGRKNVAALVKGDVEKPNDISGVVYINYVTGDGWKTDIAKELLAAGYNIDFNKIFE